MAGIRTRGEACRPSRAPKAALWYLVSRGGGRCVTRSLVTGASGSLGSALVDRLCARGDEVWMLDVTRSAHRDDVEFLEVDLRDAAAVEAACRGVDVVFHAAAMVDTRNSRRELVGEVNVGGTDHLLRGAARHGVSRFVYVSTASVVYAGEDIDGGDESLPYARMPRSHYSATKAIAERRVLSANDDGGLLCCALRPEGIYGPDDRRAIPALLESYQAGLNPFYVGFEEKLTDFVFLDSLVDAVVAADERLEPGSPVAGNAYFVTDGTPCSFPQFVQWTCEAAGVAIPRLRVPHPVMSAIASLAESLPDSVLGWLPSGLSEFSPFAVDYMSHHHWFQIDRARRDLGYEPRLTTREGIRCSVDEIEGRSRR
jgi:nucleoside-diphosphate-sugar epimerase